jgi:phosphoenolpyruvate-protein kinase (PTS system EI component)
MIDPASADPLPAANPHPVEKKEVLFHGVPASPGICRGRVLVFGAAHTDFDEIDQIPIEPSEADAEVEHFLAAVEKTKNEIKVLQDKMELMVKTELLDRTDIVL